jgi:hydrogenase expression/formation protein HypE
MKITMQHGSGGQKTAELMKDIFSKHFGNDILNKMEDSAVFELSGKVAYSTDSFVVTPLEFNGGDIGKLAVCGTVNDLLVMGAEPLYITCGFILEVGLDIELLERIVNSMAETAKAAGVKIVAGDTKVIEGNGGLYINTSGIGLIPTDRNISASNIEAGDVILLSGTLGDHHACILSSRLEIQNDIQSDCACLNDVTKILFDNNISVKAMRDVTRGGLGTILNELAEASNCQIETSEESLPIADDVKGFSDILGLDPLYMGNEGKIVVVVSSSDAQKAVFFMKSTTNAKNTAIIGKATDGKGVIMKTRIGGTRTIGVLYGEGLPRIC